MTRFLAILIIAQLLSFPARADSWAPAKVQARASANGQFVVRVIPGTSMGDVYGYGGSPKGLFARAELHRFNGSAYEKVRDLELLNPIAPVDIEVTNLGALVTIDNWHNLGMGSVLVIYSPSGEIIKKYSLSDLYSATDLNRIERTTSSFHWRCSGLSTSLESDTELWIDESLGGRFAFNLGTGAFNYQRARGGCR